MMQEEEIGALQQQVGYQDQQLRQQEQKMVMLKQEMQQLHERLKKDSHNSHLPPSSDRFGQQPRSLRKKSGKKAGGQVGHQGNTLYLSETADEVIVHAVERVQRVSRICEECLACRRNVGKAWICHPSGW